MRVCFEDFVSYEVWMLCHKEAREDKVAAPASPPPIRPAEGKRKNPTAAPAIAPVDKNSIDCIPCVSCVEPLKLFDLSSSVSVETNDPADKLAICGVDE